MTSFITIVKDNKPAFSVDQRRRINRLFSSFDNKYIQITIGKVKHARSINQNNYYWGVVLHLVAEETGHTEDDLHEICKNMFLPKKFVKLKNKEVEIAKSTTSLDTVEFENYLERIRAFFATEYAMRIPMPNEI